MGRNHFNQQRRHFPLAHSASGVQSFPVSKYHALASLIDFDSKVQVQAIGSLLLFLKSTVFQHVEGDWIPIQDLLTLQTSKFMNISADTLSALHIFATEHHPLVSAKGYGHSKEGCSLFSMMDRTKTAAGRQRLREWMLKPLRCVDSIQLRQDGVELMLRPDFAIDTNHLGELLRYMGSVAPILTRLNKSVARHKDFIALPRALAYALSVCEVLELQVRIPLQRRANQSLQRNGYQHHHQDIQQQQQQQQQQLLLLDNVPHNVTNVTQDEYQESRKVDDSDQERNKLLGYLDFVDSILGRCHVAVLQEVQGHVTSMIDEEATIENKQVVIVSGVSEELDSYKEKYENLEGILLVHERQFINRAPWLRGFTKLIFFPQVGFLLTLRDHPSWLTDVDHALPDDLKLIFNNNNVHYFKCLEVRELDEEIGDLDGKIRDLEMLITSDIEEVILDNDTEIRSTFNALADLDCILAFATVASELRYVRPFMAPAVDKCIMIQNGGHPLQELLIDEDKTFVRNDTDIDSRNRVNIITGPNFSGKSCYARQVAILTYMAHLGCFLPCEAARISTVDRILSQFSTLETCTVPQSSFQLDLTRMGTILRTATSSSLVVIDEFGKGTSPASGIGLLTAALQKLSRIGCMVLCTTHFLEMFSLGLLPEINNCNEEEGLDPNNNNSSFTVSSSGIRALQMQVQIPDQVSDSAMPLFRLAVGVAQSSAGLACARISGVKVSVLERAHEIIAIMKQGKRIEPLVEILRQFLPGEYDRATMAMVLGTDWEQATDEELAAVRERIVLSSRRSPTTLY